MVIRRFGKVSEYYDYDGRIKIGTFKISQKSYASNMSLKKLHAKMPLKSRIQA